MAKLGIKIPICGHVSFTEVAQFIASALLHLVIPLSVRVCCRRARSVRSCSGTEQGPLHTHPSAASASQEGCRACCVCRKAGGLGLVEFCVFL